MKHSDAVRELMHMYMFLYADVDYLMNSSHCLWKHAQLFSIVNRYMCHAVLGRLWAKAYDSMKMW